MRGAGKRKGGGATSQKMSDRALLAAMPALFLLGFLLSLLEGFPFRNMRILACAVVTVLWGMSLWLRLAQRTQRRLLFAAACFLLLLFGLQLLRYEMPGLPEEVAAVSRQLWYAYYIPVVFVPLLSFYAALCIGRGPGRAPLRAWFWLLLPALLLIALLQTNDLHQAAWSFYLGMERYDDYVAGPLYYAAAGWAVLLMAASLLLAGVRCSLQRAHRRSWVLLPLLLPVLVYLELYQFVNGGRAFSVGNVALLHFSECFAYLVIAFWEAMIRLGLLPANTGYGAVFRLASVNAALLDTEGRTVLASRGAEEPAGEDRRLETMAVTGGELRWVEDLSTVNALNRSLKAAAEELSGETDLIRRENEVKAELARYEAQNRLYDGLRRDLAPQLERIAALLRDGETAAEAPFRRDLALASVYCAYVKRRANLALLAREEPRLDGTSLYLSIRESLEYLRLIDLPCGVSRTGEGSLEAETAIAVYELFQRALEAALPFLRALLADLRFEDGAFSLRLELDTERELPPIGWSGPGSLRLEREDSSHWLSLVIPGEGGAS